MSEPIRLVLFDFDGVLIDSIPAMKVAWSEVQSKFSITKHFSEYSQHIGRPFPCILQKLGIPSKLHQNIQDLYGNASIANSHLIRMMPGVRPLLKTLHNSGIQVGLVTSKDLHRTSLLVDQFNLSFSIIVTPELVSNGKPHPEPILHCLSKLSKSPAETLFVGDMETDMQCARSAKVKYLHYDPGYQSMPLQDYGGIIANFEELLEYLDYLDVEH